MATPIDNNQSALGRGLLLRDGDLSFADGDFEPVAGLDNFLQGIRAMIETPLGSDVFNVAYGFDFLSIFSSAQSARMTRELIRLNLVKSLSTDNRVREIKEVVFDDEPRFFELQPEADTDQRGRDRKAARRWQALVVLRTIEG